LRDIASVFLKLGTTAFGGPAAHNAMMDNEVVRRRQWLTREQFLDYLGATNLIPGPNSTELAIHIGHARAGWRGLLVAGLCFIMPAVLIVTAIAAAYVRYGSLPRAEAVLYGVKPVVIAVVVQALWALGRTALKRRTLWLVGGGALLVAALGVNELLVLLAAAVIMALAHIIRRDANALVFLPLSGIAWSATQSAVLPVNLWTMFGVFLKVGSVLFGSGYVLLAFLRADLVERLHWLTPQQLIDAVAVGQITPGPVFTTATFIGYILAGPAGAATATFGIFLPAFVFVALSGPLVPRLRKSPAAGAVLDGVNVASLALMALVTLQLGRSALIDPVTVALFFVSAFLLLRFRVNSAWLVLGGAAIGLIAVGLS
jgi:chromate transporter